MAALRGVCFNRRVLQRAHRACCGIRAKPDRNSVWSANEGIERHCFGARKQPPFLLRCRVAPHTWSTAWGDMTQMYAR